MSNTNDNKEKNKPQQQKQEKDQNKQDGKKIVRFKFNLNMLYLLIGMMLLGLMFFNDDSSAQREVTYGEFQQYVRSGYVNRIIGYDDNSVEAFIKQQYVQQVFRQDSTRVGKKPYIMTEAPSRQSLGEFIDAEIEQSHFDGTIQYKKRQNYFWAIFWQIMPLLFFIAFMIYLSRRMSGGTGGIGGGIFNVGKSKAQLFEKDSREKVTFQDVAGLSEAKQEVEEIVEFLKDPRKYTDLGGKIPKGALLVGPPGTGKTLLAKAVAGEADVPFFSLSGSDFVEMFVGVGASRVRDLFRQAKEKTPCIVFIDEIDAVGRARSNRSAMGGNDERESTLNQLLTEMDGFGSNSGIIILAATNRVDVLDQALLRAGRFDRQIHVDLPDLNERKEIFGVHLRPIKVDETLDIDLLARQTPGFSGADIANVCNEAALIAARHGKKAVTKQDFLDAVDRIIGGLEKKNKITTEEERRSIAIHEAGHASISWLLEYANPLIKVTIVPRGRALGAAWYLPEERQITTKEQMLDEMCATLGGRAAEDLFIGKISSGAMNDLERVTKQAYGMIAYMGMSDRLPNLCYYNAGDEFGFNKPYSEHTAELIDNEVKRMINEQYERAKRILTENKEKHNQLAQRLVEREVIFAEDVEEIFGARPWASRSEEIFNANKISNEMKIAANAAKKQANEKAELENKDKAAEEAKSQTEDSPSPVESKE
ncbi:MAG: ATP-dependent zinc metalloprotease FtsH [Bacteroidaceae bacterium]|nr:ATP-dependent zinc metalloprotease FtsH [Bacteroidaceae bacterium]